jgi:dihydrodipicolinate synthase/N-acetylneuraminate lyase
MANLPPLHGVVPILVTPFDDAGNLDVESLRRLVAFNIEAGVHGLGIALGSEVYKLADDERATVVATVVDEARGRVPVVMNTGAMATNIAVRYSQSAEAAGIDAVMCAGPGPGIAAGEVRHYYRTISDAVKVPVIVQDTAANHIPAPLLRAISEESERVCYAKVESSPPARRVYDAVQACGERVAIFGGSGGSAFLQELRRGSIGTMPWPSTPHAFVEVWDRWQAGDRAEAQRIFDERLVPIGRLEMPGLSGGQMLHKELLKRQGIIATAQVRRPADEFDPITWEELAEVCDRLGLNGGSKG